MKRPAVKALRVKNSWQLEERVSGSSMQLEERVSGNSKSECQAARRASVRQLEEPVSDAQKQRMQLRIGLQLEYLGDQRLRLAMPCRRAARRAYARQLEGRVPAARCSSKSECPAARRASSGSSMQFEERVSGSSKLPLVRQIETMCQIEFWQLDAVRRASVR